MTKMVSKVFWCLMLPFALAGDGISLLCSIFSAFDGGGEIGCAGFTDGVYDRLSGKQSPPHEAKMPECVSKESAKSEKGGFDWVRLIVWGGLTVLLAIAVLALMQ